MAFVAIPGLIALVPHASGGAILSTSAGGYVAGTLIPASVVAAAPAIAIGAVAVTAAAAGAYFYIHGIPLPLAELLAAKGITVKAGATAAKAAAAAVTDPIAATKSVMTAVPAAAVVAVPAAKVVLVLAALAAVGYFAYTSSQDVKDAVDDLARKAEHEENGLAEKAGLIEEFRATLSTFIATTSTSASAQVQTIWSFIRKVLRGLAGVFQWWKRRID
jgi:hypothetical protein